MADEADGEPLLQAHDAVALDELVGEEHDLRLVDVRTGASGEFHVQTHDSGRARVAQPLEQVGACVRVTRLRAGDVVQQPAREHERLAQVLPARIEGGGERSRHRRHGARVRHPPLGHLVRGQQLETASLVRQSLARRAFPERHEVILRVGVEQHPRIADLDDRRPGDVPHEQRAQAAGRPGRPGGDDLLAQRGGDERRVTGDAGDRRIDHSGRWLRSRRSVAPRRRRTPAALCAPACRWSPAAPAARRPAAGRTGKRRGQGPAPRRGRTRTCRRRIRGWRRPGRRPGRPQPRLHRPGAPSPRRRGRCRRRRTPRPPTRAACVPRARPAA